MKTLTIEQKMSGTGTAKDLASDSHDRIIRFKPGFEFAVVIPAFFGFNRYSTHSSIESANKKYESMKDFHPCLIDSDGDYIDHDGSKIDVFSVIDTDLFPLFSRSASV